jgi:predicted ATPase
MWRLEVKDFGPIREGGVTLRPLTIFIGANNTGKSYMAQVAYALGSLFPSPSLDRPWRSYRVGPLIDIKLDPESFQALTKLRRRKQPLPLDELPEEARLAFEQRLDAFFGHILTRAADELQRCFGSTVQELVRQNAKSFSVALAQPQPLARFKLALEGGQLRLTEKAWNREIELHDTDFVTQPGGRVLMAPVWPPAFRVLLTRVHYLPAARSGILQGHKALASFILSRLPLVGIERFEIPRLSGVVADFLGRLLSIERRRQGSPVAAVADFLESEICQGRIELERTQPEVGYPELYYRQRDLKLPLHRTSSMVSELAPIVLFLRYVVATVDLLISEEPEAHLHPDHQLSLARGIARLIRHGVQVLVTTHSDYFLHQISNLVQAGGADQKTRASLKYLEEERLKAEEVGVYLFKGAAMEGGTTVEELKVTEEDGIPQDEFVRIAEQLYDETVRLDRTYSWRR